MTTTTRTAATEETAANSATPTDAAESLTPNARQWWQRYQRWVWGVLILLLVGGVTIATYGGLSINSDRFLDPSSATPNGSKALVNTIANQGVEFTHAESLAELDLVMSEDGSTTLVVEDPYYALEAEDWEALLASGADRFLVLSTSLPSQAVAEQVASYKGNFEPRTDADGNVINEDMPETFPAESSEVGTCPDALAANAPEITNLGGREFTPTDDASGCYPVRDGYALVIGEVDGVEIVVLGTPSNLTNEQIVSDANAAMAINVLGAHDKLVWYTPNAADYSEGPSFGSYIPQWLLPSLLLIYLAGFTVVVWRGRRFGPLVTERLPVTVPANETLEGRARLYDASNSRLRALDSIRIGTISRLADLAGLGNNASTQQVIAATAGLAGVSLDHAHRVLLAAEPETDRELVEFANAVAELERRVRATTGRTKPTRASTTRHDTNNATNKGKQGNEHDE
ncbi:MAG: DUF4350 domain-containing protein [Gulosibacter sp.]|uniref:DUF4350 domain-containing protein n=1 Tax=Gulosibacter sp. TaxID=2817531 RepID=UPI003F90FF36